MDHFKGIAGRKFRASYAHFWAAALRKLGELDALQDALLEPLQNLLTSLVWCAPGWRLAAQHTAPMLRPCCCVRLLLLLLRAPVHALSQEQRRLQAGPSEPLSSLAAMQ